MKLSLHWKILLAIVIGGALGVGAHELAGDSPVVSWVTDNLTHTVGQLWLRALKMLAIPMIFAALVVGIGELDPRRLGRIGLKTLGYVVATSTVAVVIGLVFVNVFQPGATDSEHLRALAYDLAGGKAVVAAPDQTAAEMVVALVPDNPVKAAAQGDMIGVLVFGLFVGIGAALVRSPGTQRFVEVMQGLYDIAMRLVLWLVKLAPIAVACLVFTTMTKLGVEILLNVAAFVAVVVGALLTQMVVVYPVLLKSFARTSPLAFFRAIRLAMGTAFATASSNATLPTSLEVAEQELALPRGIARFVLTAGSTMNQHGTALFEGVTVLFLAQLFGVELGLGQQASVMFICILGGVGTAGIPAGSLPVVAMILSMFGIPEAGLALVLGVDRFLDMCRTTLNVTGDLVVAACVSAGEAADLPEPT